MRLAALAAGLALLATPVTAEPTQVMVRAQSLDAKFIGDQMGGVQVILRDARTGRVLARGLTQGGTGDTNLIMKTPRSRGASITDAATAGFNAIIDVREPTLIEAEAEGPMGKPASRIRVTSRLWILPGRDVTGDGWILTFPGLVIEPEVTQTTAAAGRVSAKVTLMCGCPIEPGGLWDSANYVIQAELRRGDQVVARAPLAYAGTPSLFAGAFPALPPGRYRLRVTAMDKSTPNAGFWEGAIRLR